MASMVGGHILSSDASAARPIQIRALLYAKPEVEYFPVWQAVVTSPDFDELILDFGISGGRFFSSPAAANFHAPPEEVKHGTSTRYQTE
jgi:hypothetical protein